MTTISRLRATWTGFPGAPGVTTLYSTNTDGWTEDTATLFNTLTTLIPSDVTITTDGSGDLLEDTTGELTGGWSGGDPVAITGSYGGVYAAPVGACIDWISPEIFAGHRARGRTFLVPLAATAFQTNGSILDTALAAIQDAADAYVIARSGGFCIWHRPRVARAADGSRPAVTARAGGHSLVTSAHVPDLASVLRSRRD